MLARLDRIEALDRANAQQGAILDELRELVREVELWASCERVCDVCYDPRPARVAARVDGVPSNERKPA